MWDWPQMLALHGDRYDPLPYIFDNLIRGVGDDQQAIQYLMGRDVNWSSFSLDDVRLHREVPSDGMRVVGTIMRFDVPHQCDNAVTLGWSDLVDRICGADWSDIFDDDVDRQQRNYSTDRQSFRARLSEAERLALPETTGWQRRVDLSAQDDLALSHPDIELSEASQDVDVRVGTVVVDDRGYFPPPNDDGPRLAKRAYSIATFIIDDPDCEDYCVRTSEVVDIMVDLGDTTMWVRGGWMDVPLAGYQGAVGAVAYGASTKQDIVASRTAELGEQLADYSDCPAQVVPSP